MNTTNLLIDTLITDNVLNNDLTTKTNKKEHVNTHVINSFYKSIINELNTQLHTVLNKLSNPEVSEKLMNDLINRREIINHITVHELSKDIKQSNKAFIREIYSNGYKNGCKQLNINNLQFSENSKTGLKYVQNNSYNRINNLSKDVREGIREAIWKHLATGASIPETTRLIKEAGLKDLTLIHNGKERVISADVRAKMIARTETAEAYTSASLQSYYDNGVVKYGIQTAEDDLVCIDCLQAAFDCNEFVESMSDVRDGGYGMREHPLVPVVDGVIGDAPPIHPNCRCSVVPLTDVMDYEPYNPDELRSNNLTDMRIGDIGESTPTKLPEEIHEDVLPQIIEFGNKRLNNKIEYGYQFNWKTGEFVGKEIRGGKDGVTFIGKDKPEYGTIHTHPKTGMSPPSVKDIINSTITADKYHFNISEKEIWLIESTANIGLFGKINPKFNMDFAKAVNEAKKIVSDKIRHNEIKTDAEITDITNKIVGDKILEYFNTSENLDKYGLKIMRYDRKSLESKSNESSTGKNSQEKQPKENINNEKEQNNNKEKYPIEHELPNGKKPIRIRETTDGEEMVNKLKEAYDTQPIKNQWRVDLGYKAEDYKDCKMYVSEHGSTLVIKPNGDIVSVCTKINPNNVKDSMHTFLDFAVKNGGTKFDSYDGNYEVYRHFGFEPVSWCEFDPEFADQWKQAKEELEKQGETLKEEHIIFFKYTGKQSKYEKAEDFYNNVPASKDYDTAEKVRDDNMEKNISTVKTNSNNKNKFNRFQHSQKELEVGLNKARSKKGYPMTYDEFEKRVIELFLNAKDNASEVIEDKKQLLKELDYGNDLIMVNQYLTACHVYDTQHINVFTDFQLESQAVRTLEMIM